ncbi:MAG: hypothetical protein ABSF89_11745 [Acidimicrobiales bacterium]|jgi:hypothetical protein
MTWSEAATVAQVVAAVALIVSALYLRSSAKETKALAMQTKALGDDTKALAVEEQLDREIRYRPHVVATMQHTPIRGGEYWRVRMRNVGVGPALDLSVAFVGNRGEFGSRRSLVLDAGEALQLDIRTEVLTHPEGLFNPPPGFSMPGGSQYLVVVCNDVLGIRLRFLDGLPPEPWRASSGVPAPPWTKW